MTNDPNEGEMPLRERLEEATRLAEEGEEGQALELLLALEADHPRDATLLCLIGALAAHAGAEGMAGDYFRRCLEEEPMDPELLVTAGAGLAALSDPAAEPALRLAALTAPDHAGARMHYGAYLVRGGMTDTGLEELLAARALDPDDPDIRRELGIAYLLIGRPEPALSELEEGVEASPEDDDLRLLLGLAVVQDGDMARAAEVLYPLAVAMPEDVEVQVLLALLFQTEDWEEEAWIAFSRAEAVPEGTDRAWLMEVEESLQGGTDAARALLLEEVAPTMLRERLYG